MDQNTIAFLEKHATGCKCDANERWEDDCTEPCPARIARDALSEIAEVADMAKRQIDQAPNVELRRGRENG